MDILYLSEGRLHENKHFGNVVFYSQRFIYVSLILVQEKALSKLFLIYTRGAIDDKYHYM